MKVKLLVFTFVVPVMIFTSCATTNFVEYRGPSIVEGKGGTVRNLNGMDFWDSGEPNRKYKIVGMINDSRDYGKIASSFRDSFIAKLAREKGGDAVIFISNSMEYSGVDFVSKGPDYTRISRFLVVKYLSQ